MTLAHHGVLFLDELPEFQRPVLECLRQPLESGDIHVGRVRHSVRFPAAFQLVAAMNPCPCGFHGEGGRPCRCPPAFVARYRSRISGPLLDRVDIHLTVRPVTSGDVLGPASGETTAVVRERVHRARRTREERFRAARTPVRMSVADVKQASASGPFRSLVSWAMDDLGMSARGVTRAFRVARTIADLAGSERIEPLHFEEAIQFRAAADLGEPQPARLPGRPSPDRDERGALMSEDAGIAPPDGSAMAEAVRLFNERAYYESHDVLEEEWAAARGTRREALKALVKLAAGMYHLQTSGYRGAASLLSSGLAALDGLPPDAVFVEVSPLRDPIARCLEKIRTLESGGNVEWAPADLPRLLLVPDERTNHSPAVRT